MKANPIFKNREEDYCFQISKMQNKIRTKLAAFVPYRSDKHFLYMSGNNNTIHPERILEIIPFKNEYIGFNPSDYLPAAIYRLNRGDFRNFNIDYQMNGKELEYRGYMQLITTDRPSNSGGSEVNKTLFHRSSLEHEIDTILRQRDLSYDLNKKINSIIGMLFFLQCLKQAEKQELGKRKNQDYHDHLREQIQIRNSKNLKQHINSKNQFQPLNKYEFIKEQLYQKKQNPYQQQQGRSISACPFLEKFSNPENVWKNIAERNWDNKMAITTRASSTAFIYEQNTSSRKFYAKSPRSVSSRRPINKMDRAYYYLK